MTGWFAIPLWKRVMAGLVLGLIFALVAPQWTPHVAFLGDLFVRAIRMLVAPIVLVTIAAGITALADPKKLGSLGARTVGMFAFTTFLAVSVGLIVATIVQPGVGAPIGNAAPHALGKAVTPYEQLVGIVPLNIVEALAKGDMLALIFVAIMMGVGTVVAGEAGKPFADLLQSLSSVLLRVVGLVMEAAPFGVFALIAIAVANNGAAVFIHVGWLALAVVLGSLVQMVVVHSLILRLLARLPVLPFFRKAIDALVVAFSTSSSAATLPVEMRIAGDKLGVARPIYSTVLPLGASIGKDGTAMYVGLLTVFALQALGLPITPWTYAVALVAGAVTSFGTAPVPSASLFMLAAVMSAVGATPEQTALIVGFVLPFDRLLDMTRTVPSVCANMTVTTTVAKWEGELDESVFRDMNAGLDPVVADTEHKA